MFGVNYPGAPYFGQAFALVGELVIVAPFENIIELIGAGNPDVELIGAASDVLQFSGAASESVDLKGNA